MVMIEGGVADWMRMIKSIADGSGWMGMGVSTKEKTKYLV